MNVGKDDATAVRRAGRGSSVGRQTSDGSRKRQELGIERGRRVRLGRSRVEDPSLSRRADARHARAHVGGNERDRAVGGEYAQTSEPESKVIALDEGIVDLKGTRGRALRSGRQPARDALEIGRTVPEPRGLVVGRQEPTAL